MQQTQTLGEQGKTADLVSQIREWLFREQSLAEAQREQLAARQKTEVQAARQACSVVKSLIDSAAESSDTSQAVLSLSREAVYWSLRALSPREVQGTPSLADLFGKFAPETAKKLAGSESALGLVREVLVGKTFVESVELDEAHAHSAALAAHQFAEQLLALADKPDRRLESIRVQRWARPLLSLITIIVVVYGIIATVRYLRRPAELATGKTWRVSSVYATFPGTGKVGYPKVADDFLFHTTSEDSPWMEIDLEQTVSVSKVHVENRKSCCADRAVPLIVETSTDQKTWSEAAKRTEEFIEWDPTFPGRPARYVRLRVPRNTALHLSAVQVY